MSHIPSSAIPHAKKHERHDAPAARPAKDMSSDAARIGREALAAVKAHPKTAIAIGATIVAGAVAAVAAPLLARRADEKPKRPRAAKKTKSA